MIPKALELGNEQINQCLILHGNIKSILQVQMKEVKGVKFDGYKDIVLIEAKEDYSEFVDKSTGEFYDWLS